MRKHLPLILAGCAVLCLAPASRAEHDDPREFIRTLVRKYMNRPANASEVESWVRNIQNGYSATDVHLGFLASDEFYRRHGGDPESMITALFRETLGRRPNQTEMRNWLRHWNDLGADHVQGRQELVKDFLATVRPPLRPNPPLPEHMPAKLIEQARMLAEALYNEVGDEGGRLHSRAAILLHAAQYYRDTFLTPGISPRQVHEAYRSLAGAHNAFLAELNRYGYELPATAGYAESIGSYLAALRGQLPAKIAPARPFDPRDIRD
jgi:hypothetical protein